MNSLPYEIENMINVYKKQLENNDNLLNQIKTMKKEYRNIVGHVNVYYLNKNNEKMVSESIYNFFDNLDEQHLDERDILIMQKKILTIRNNISIHLNNEINNKMTKQYPEHLRKLYEGEILIFNKDIECIE